MCGIWAIFGIPDYPKYASFAMNISGRGPDCFRMETIPHFQDCCLVFHRLAVVDDLYGMQPMRVKKLPHLYLIYNGEIYNHKATEEKYGFDVMTKCDGEVILHLYDKFGAEKTAQMLDGVFAFCIIDTKKKQIHLGRDTFGVRPMFTLEGKANKKGVLALCSEIKSLVPVERHIASNGHKMVLDVFPPGHYASYDLSPNGSVTLIEKGPYTFIGKRPVFDTRVAPTSSDAQENIRQLFTEAVRKRLMADRRIGCLLSGGLDSSLVASLLTKLAKESGIDYPIQTFSIGMEGSTDILAARKVAAHIGSEHHEVTFSAQEGIDALRDVIYALESYDITTIRASVGMYLVAKYIKEKTDTVVVYSGEGSDELCQGYIYFHKAPSAEQADKESRRLLEDLYAFDVLRSDRSTAVHGLEIRVPFLDVDFTSYILSIPAELRQPQDGMEKWLLRSAFDSTNLLPKDILWRPKEAFSDGVSGTEPGKSWFEILQKHVSTQVPDEALSKAEELYPFNTPKTKEAFYYRQIFEESFSGHENLIPYLWMPRWTEATDPSARTLSHYK
ncbi:asparagine synthetase [glutamine-hydrolyzing]-like [Actinia tenebrosa]|uniref:Asparagine synthetase [glutamine-hydrolyzing] n=1 Tax=Actinia tenebrosa TaxID=6105 RepID=A0A6P8IIX7_ACTTE|nr:asparagine synthetase [glutamine-hydrolyzing]-like [Actinia tenebrosa]